MIFGHGTEKLLSIGFEILVLETGLSSPGTSILKTKHTSLRGLLTQILTNSLWPLKAIQA